MQNFNFLCKLQLLERFCLDNFLSSSACLLKAILKHGLDVKSNVGFHLRFKFCFLAGSFINTFSYFLLAITNFGLADLLYA